MTRMRERLNKLDESAGLTGNTLPGWFSALVILVLVVLLIIGIVRGDQEVVLFAGLVLGLFLGVHWRMTRR